MHITSWRAYFDKVNPFFCFLKGIEAKNSLVLETAPLLPSQLPTKMGTWWGKVLLPNPVSNRAVSSSPQELHMIPLLSLSASPSLPSCSFTVFSIHAISLYFFTEKKKSSVSASGWPQILYSELLM